MSDVWEFKNGVMRIVEMENLGGRRPQQLLVYLQTEKLITSHQMLEDRLRDEGWVHYLEMPPELIEYHRGPDKITSSPFPRTSPGQFLSSEQALPCDYEQTLLYTIRAPNLGMVLSSSSGVMSEVWKFKNGVMRKVENPDSRRPRKVLVYLPTVEVITSHQMLENRLRDEGWVHYPDMQPELI
ncbi:hypothetical protein ZIOFF_035115 [Zingiber officinale]|uniref:Uncharacterized protein n=1 Tax=Zingiber officinale TaxID=94328 RepID=A0A8J5L2F2_ZINOF|nr:hypothetical protein ZIOFF_035115 [Zingiber officinale]